MTELTFNAKKHFIHKIMVAIFRFCEQQYRNKNIANLDKLLLEIKLQNLDIDIIGSWICATFPFKEMLSNRVQLIKNCKDELMKRKFDDYDEVFKNLE